MDNLENYLYLAFAVVYIISRIIKARSKQKESNSGTGQQRRHKPAIDTHNQPKPRKAFSFEDILKEFEQNLTGQEHVEESPFPVQEIRHEMPKPVPVVEDKKRPSLFDKYQGTNYSSASKTRASEKIGSFFRDDKYSISESSASKYAKMLKSPEGIRDAVVLTEIFNRKY